MSDVRIKKWEDLPVTTSETHPKLFHKEFLSPEDADYAKVAANSILYEKLEKGGSILPHYHNVSEIICITKGRVRLYADGAWREYSKYDTFIVPAGAVHSVCNIFDDASEQISVFLPVCANERKNVPFETELLSGDRFEEIMRTLKSEVERV